MTAPPDTCAHCFDSGTICSVCYREWLEEERRQEAASVVMAGRCFLFAFVAAIAAATLIMKGIIP